MKDFLVLIRGGESEMETLSEEKRKAHFDKWGAFMGSLSENGNLAGGLPLMPHGKLMCSKGAQDGIAKDERGDSIGGYLLVKANDYDHAVKLTGTCPVFEFNGNLEIREAMHMEA